MAACIVLRCLDNSATHVIPDISSLQELALVVASFVKIVCMNFQITIIQLQCPIYNMYRMFIMII